MLFISSRFLHQHHQTTLQYHSPALTLQLSSSSGQPTSTYRTKSIEPVAPMDTDRYLPLNDERSIRTLRFAALPSPTPEPDIAIEPNHWVIYILTVGDNRILPSIQLQAVRQDGFDEEYTASRIDWQLSSLRTSTTETRYGDFQADNMTVAKLFRIMYSNNFQYYLMPDGGRDSRFWM